jgi:hypothetical protein
VLRYLDNALQANPVSGTGNGLIETDCTAAFRACKRIRLR